MGEKTNKVLYSVCIMLILIIITSYVMVLAPTIKHKYFDEIVHYHVNTCHIINCSSVVSQCCSIDKIGRDCHICYNIEVIYDLILDNTDYRDDTYTKTSWGSVHDSDYCNRTTIVCYYDDRRIFDSLNPWNAYTAKDITIIIFFLVAGLFVMVAMILATVFVVNCLKSKEK